MTETRRLNPPQGRFAATVDLPGDKSLSHRALIFSAMAEGQSRITGLGTGADVVSTARVLGGLGVEFAADGDAMTVTSGGVRAWTEPAEALREGRGASLFERIRELFRG